MPRADAPPGAGRDLPSWLIPAAGCLLALRLRVATAQRLHPPRTPDLVAWTVVGEAEARAKASGKPLLYEFSAEWCGPCKIMQREVFANAKSAELINARYIPVRILDTDRSVPGGPDLNALRLRFGITAYPTLVVVRPGGAFEQSRGYGGAAPTIAWLTAQATGPGGQTRRKIERR